MQEQFLIRQADLISSDVLKAKINIIGAGAIGSFTALTLAKMGFTNITVWDDDEVSPENMNCQFFRTNDIDKPKTQALEEVIYEFTGTVISTNNVRVDRSVMLRGDITICAVDCMDSRNIILEQCCSKFLIDARMGAEYIMMYSVCMNSVEDIENYKKSLYSNAEAVQERCTAKSTMYTVNLIAGLIGKTVKDIMTDSPKTITGLDWSVKENSAVWFAGKQKLTL